MIKFLRSHKWIAACCIAACLLAGSWVWSLTSSIQSRVAAHIDAQKDLASGHYILLGYGMPLAWNSEFDQCLGQYGIEVRNVGGDVFESGRDVSTGTELSYYQSYNATSSAAIKQKFGPVFERCMDSARKKWESSHLKPPHK
jgi:hypothetical protein